MIDIALGRLLAVAGEAAYGLTHGSTVDLAVTGLSRAGKTVFVTSLVHNLLRSNPSLYPDGGSLQGFAPLKSGALKNVILPPAGHPKHPLFPFDQCLTRLASGTPEWPKRTDATSQIAIWLQFGHKRNSGNATRKAATIKLRIMDYPGEWLLDLPLLDQTFEQWSAATIALSREGSRATFSTPWREFLETRDHTGSDEDEFPREAAKFYQKYLVDCRRRGLRFIQPGQFLMLPGQTDEDTYPILDQIPRLWFCPLPPAPQGKWRTGSIGASMAARYEHYRTATVGDFVQDTFGRFGRQLVLVDVLGALSAGRESFEDTCRAVAEVCRCLRANADGLWNRVKSLSYGSTIDKIAFAATKADHVPQLQRGSLAHLLLQMLGNEASAARWGGTEIMTTYIASVCSTQEDSINIDGQMFDAIVGRRKDTGKRAKVIVKPIPGSIPNQAFWCTFEKSGAAAFDYPKFSPPPIDINNAAGIPHLGLEKLLNFLIGDQFK